MWGVGVLGGWRQRGWGAVGGSGDGCDVTLQGRDAGCCASTAGRQRSACCELDTCLGQVGQHLRVWGVVGGVGVRGWA